MESERSAILRVKGADSVPMVLVANGCDESDPEVSTAEGQKLAESWGCPFFEASAKTGQNVNEVFYEAVRQYWDSGIGNRNINESGRKHKDDCIIM